MNYLLIEESKILPSYIPTLCRSYPKETIYSIHSTRNELPYIKPITGNYMILCYPTEKNCVKLLAHVKTIIHMSHLVIVLERYNKEIIKFARQSLGELKILKNKAKPEDIEAYINNKLEDVCKTGRELIFSKFKYSERLTVEIVNILKQKEKVTIAIIKEVIEEMNKPRFTEIYEHLILDGGDKQRIVSLLHRFKFSYKTIKKYLDAEIELDINVFTDIMEEKLTKGQKRIYLENKNISYYRLNKSIEYYRKVSLEKLILLKLKMSSIVNIFQLYDLLF